MPSLFSPLSIGALELPNRFVRSATLENLGDRGRVNDPLLALYRDLAQGEVGLIVTGGLFPVQAGQILPGQLGAHREEMIPGLSRLTRVVHQHGGRIAGQLLHSGWNCRPEITGADPTGPSPVVHPISGPRVRALSSGEIEDLIVRFAKAAQRLLEAGFDAVQLHAAHNELISCFLSPVTNRRRDAWGGSSEKRSRILRRIIAEIQALAGPDYPILVKLGLMDYDPGGKSLPEGLETGRTLEAAGVQAIEVSKGIEDPRSGRARLRGTRPYYAEECRRARAVLHGPLVLVGGMRTLQDMQAVIAEGVADAVSMSRPFIADPHIVRKLRQGACEASGCTSCDKCRDEMRSGRMRCVLR